MRPLDSATSKSIHIQIDRSASEIAVVAAHKLPWKNLCEIKIQELTLKAEILGNTILHFGENLCFCSMRFPQICLISMKSEKKLKIITK